MCAYIAALAPLMLPAVLIVLAIGAATHRRPELRTTTALVLGLLALAGDCGTTWWAVSQGLTETNPLLQEGFASIGLIPTLALKAALTTTLMAGVWWYRSRWLPSRPETRRRRLALRWGWAMSAYAYAVMAAVVVSNTYAIGTWLGHL